MSEPQEIGDRAFRFAVRIVRFCQRLDKGPRTHWTLTKQLLRSGTSVGANIEEGKAGQSRADFIAKYFIALKEARETHYWLRLIQETEASNQEGLPALIREADEIISVLTIILKNARAKK